MDDEIEIEWNVDDEYSREEAKEIKNQIKKQADEEIKFYEAEELSAGAAEVAISYIIMVGSGFTANAIYDALMDRDETHEINVDIDIEIYNNSDTSFKLNND
jgi:hypothetical protein